MAKKEATPQKKPQGKRAPKRAEGKKVQK